MTATAIKASLRQSRLFSFVLLLIAAGAFYVAVVVQSEPGKTVTLSFGAAPTSQSPADTASVPALSAFQQAVQALLTQIDKTDPFDASTSGAWATASQSLEPFSEAESAELRKQIAALTALDKRLSSVRLGAPAVVRDLEGLIGRGAPLYKGFVTEGSLFEQMAATLELLKPDFVALAAKKPVENIKAFQINLKALIEQRAKLNEPGLAAQFNDRRRAITEKIDSAALMRAVKDWESAVFAYMARVAEIRRIAEPLVKPPESPGAAAADGPIEIDREILFRLLIALGVIGTLGSIGLVMRGDSQVLAAFDQSRSSDQPDSTVTQSVVDNLPYLQLAAKQSAELGRQVALSLKKLVNAAAAAAKESNLQANQGASDQGSSIPGALDQGREMLKAILHQHSTLKEHAIQLSITVNQSMVDPKVHDAVDRFVESIEHIETRMEELFQRFVALGESANSQPSVQSDAGRGQDALGLVGREAEGLLVAVSQWSRQFDRLTETLQGLEESLYAATPADTPSNAHVDSSEPGFKRGMD